MFRYEKIAMYNHIAVQHEHLKETLIGR